MTTLAELNYLGIGFVSRTEVPDLTTPTRQAGILAEESLVDWDLYFTPA